MILVLKPRELVENVTGEHLIGMEGSGLRPHAKTLSTFRQWRDRKIRAIFLKEDVQKEIGLAMADLTPSSHMPEEYVEWLKRTRCFWYLHSRPDVNEIFDFCDRWETDTHASIRKLLLQPD